MVKTNQTLSNKSPITVYYDRYWTVQADLDLNLYDCTDLLRHGHAQSLLFCRVQEDVVQDGFPHCIAVFCVHLLTGGKRYAPSVMQNKGTGMAKTKSPNFSPPYASSSAKTFLLQSYTWEDLSALNSHISGWTYLPQSYIWEDISASVKYLGGPFHLSHMSGRTFLPQ